MEAKKLESTKFDINIYIEEIEKRKKIQKINNSILSYDFHALEYLRDQYYDISRNPISNFGITVGLINDNLFEWIVSLFGARDTSYKNGFYKLIIIFPENYPQCSPDIIFLTPIYHLNVNPFEKGYDDSDELGHGNQKPQLEKC